MLRSIKSIMQYQVAPRSNALIQVKVVNSSQFAGKEVVLSPINEDVVTMHMFNTFIGIPVTVVEAKS